MKADMAKSGVHVPAPSKYSFKHLLRTCGPSACWNCEVRILSHDSLHSKAYERLPLILGACLENICGAIGYLDISRNDALPLTEGVNRSQNVE